MAHFPVDAPRDRVIKAFERLGFRLVREGNHIAMALSSSKKGGPSASSLVSADTEKLCGKAA